MNKSGLIYKILIRRSACPSYKCFPAETAPLAQASGFPGNETALQLLQPFFELLLGLAAVNACVAAAGHSGEGRTNCSAFLIIHVA